MKVALVALVVCATAAAGATGATSATAGDQRLLINQPAGSNATEARIGTIVALSKKACPDQVGQCEEDDECAQEIDSLIRGAQPISAAAKALVQCVSSNIVALAKKACPDQVGQCEEDNECAQEIDSLIRGAQPISAAAQALVQCVSSNTAQIRLQLRSLRSKQSVEQAAFGRALRKKAASPWFAPSNPIRHPGFK
jgi:hypothetical protein